MRDVLELALKAAEKLVVGLAEGPHALPLELGGDVVEIHTGIICGGEHVLGSRDVSIHGASRFAVVGERAQRLLGHRVHHVGAHELADIDHVGVVRILGAGAGPQRSLRAGSKAAQALPIRAGELGEVPLVCDPRVGDRDTPRSVESSGSRASTLVSIRERKNEATDAISRSGSPRWHGR